MRTMRGIGVCKIELISKNINLGEIQNWLLSLADYYKISE
jgi:hypothetical protein